MIKMLHFSGPCSFATFLAVAGERVLPAVRMVRTFEQGGVVCFLDLAALAEDARVAVTAAVRTAHAVEPVKLDHDVEMAPAVLAFVADRLNDATRP